MKTWEYKKLALNEAARKSNNVDLLCDAGEDGWELVAILPNGIAFLKREVEDWPAEQEQAAVTEEPEGVQSAIAEVGSVASNGGTAVKPKYRDPATGETWSGRGRMATWLKRKQEAGEDIEKYRS